MTLHRVPSSLIDEAQSISCGPPPSARRPPSLAACRMPAVSVIDLSRHGDGHVASLLFPRQDEAGTWRWDELTAAPSPIEGYGLHTRHASGFPWRRLPKPVLIPLLGRETEVGSAVEAAIFQRVLRGVFTLLPFERMAFALPAEHVWGRRGPFLEAVPRGGSDAPANLSATDEVLQVPLREHGRLQRGEQGVVYLVKEEILQLLHIPPHMFRSLAMHARGHHIDRHFCTHVVYVRKAAHSHVLVNAHPIFGESAYAGGLVNEAVDAPPSLEMHMMQVQLVMRNKQCPSVLSMWDAFVAEFPEVLETHCFYRSIATSFEDGEELTCSYGPEYQRHYDTWDYAAVPFLVRLPLESFSEEHTATQAWPSRVPAWWNAAMQPLRRKAFRLTSDGIEPVKDWRRLVLAHRLLPPQLEDLKTTVSPFKGRAAPPLDASPPQEAKRCRRDLSAAYSGADEERPLLHSRRKAASLDPPPAAPPLHEESPSSAAPPLHADAALRRRVLVRSSLWPTYSCDENEGRGWSAKVVKVNRQRRAALVQFLFARNDQGRKYPSEWIQLEELELQ